MSAGVFFFTLESEVKQTAGLYDYQEQAMRRMKNGCILCGGVGSGKSRTALAYYFTQQGGTLGGDAEFPDLNYVPMSDPPKDLYIITTARKRDTLEWNGELARFLLSHTRSNSSAKRRACHIWGSMFSGTRSLRTVIIAVVT